MAKSRHISTKLVLVLDAGTGNGKKTTKRVTISNIREDASTDALWELAQALGKLLEYPVAEVRLYKVEEIEREARDGAADEKAGVQKDVDADMARSDDTRPDGEALPMAASRVGVGTGNGLFTRGNVKMVGLSIPAGFGAGSPRCVRDDRDSVQQRSKSAGTGCFAVSVMTGKNRSRDGPKAVIADFWRLRQKQAT